MTTSQIKKLIVAVFGSELIGGLAVMLSSVSVTTWYPALVKPALNPPSWVFGPVWTTLYALMGVAAFLVWKRPKSPARDLALAVFLGQLVLNGLWSFLFFGLQSPGLALIEFIILWGAIIATIMLFWKQYRPAAYLLAPYFLWVSFALYLNFEIWRLNM